MPQVSGSRREDDEEDEERAAPGGWTDDDKVRDRQADRQGPLTSHS